MHYVSPPMTIYIYILFWSIFQALSCWGRRKQMLKNFQTSYLCWLWGLWCIAPLLHAFPKREPVCRSIPQHQLINSLCWKELKSPCTQHPHVLFRAHTECQPNWIIRNLRAKGGKKGQGNLPHQFSVTYNCLVYQITILQYQPSFKKNSKSVMT